MRKIQLTKIPQPDGSLHHVSGVGCSMEPCVKIQVNCKPPDVCACLHNDGVDEDENLLWKCSKTPCRSGA